MELSEIKNIFYNFKNLGVSYLEQDENVYRNKFGKIFFSVQIQIYVS